MSDYFYRERQKQKIRKAKKNLKRHRDTKPPRQKRWTMDDLDDDDRILSHERIMPLDERDRRAKVENLAKNVVLGDDGDEPYNDLPDDDQWLKGIVTEVSSGECRALVDGETWRCIPRGSLSAEDTGYTNTLAVGDEVVVYSDGEGRGVIEAVMPRRSVLGRPDPHYGHLIQAIAANIDQLLIVASWRMPQFWTELVDRYLITAERYNIQPILCINKIDLAENRDEIDTFRMPYEALGVTVVLTSVLDGIGIDELRELMRGKTSVLAGLSGVGKSSLLTAIHPDFDLKTGEVSDKNVEGKHTTTQATMLPFGEDGFVIDTPGIRSFGLAGLDADELGAYYPEFARYVGMCKFSNCSHQHEPDCAVRDAAEANNLPMWRYENYLGILNTLDS